MDCVTLNLDDYGGCALEVVIGTSNMIRLGTIDHVTLCGNFCIISFFLSL